jgi:hypothetical protein
MSKTIKVQPETEEMRIEHEQYVTSLEEKVLAKIEKATRFAANEAKDVRSFVVIPVKTPQTEDSLELNKRVERSKAVQDKISSLNQQYINSIEFYTASDATSINIFVEGQRKRSGCSLQ